MLVMSVPGGEHRHHAIDDEMLGKLDDFKSSVFHIEILAWLNLLFMVSFLSRFIILQKIGRTMNIFSMACMADVILFVTSLFLLEWIYGFHRIFSEHNDID